MNTESIQIKELETRSGYKANIGMFESLGYRNPAIVNRDENGGRELIVLKLIGEDS